MSEINNVVESLSDTELITVLAKIGLAYEEVSSSVYIVSLDGFNASEFRFNIVLVNMQDILLLSAKFSDEISQSSLIQWNTNYPCAKAYIQNDNSVTVSASHYIRGGVTLLNIIQFFAQFHNDLQTFSTEIL